MAYIMHCFLSGDGVIKRPLSWKQRTRIILQVAEGTLYTSPNPIISKMLNCTILECTFINVNKFRVLNNYRYEISTKVFYKIIFFHYLKINAKI